MTLLKKNINLFLTQATLCLGLFSTAVPSQAQNIGKTNSVTNLRSVQFERLCFQRSVACADIGKAAHMSSALIYQLFDTERTGNKTKRSNVINQIKRLYGAKQIDVINKRMKLSDFFLIRKEQDKIFGGYAVLIRQPEVGQFGKRKVSYAIAFKGTYVGLEDPNDLAAISSGVPVNMYRRAAALIHEGFRNYAGQVFNDIKSKELLVEILSLQKQANTEVEILVTGHSLGAASILYTAMLVDAGVLPSNIRTIVFGAPAFTQPSFANRYRTALANTTRVETKGDFFIYQQRGYMQPIYNTLGYLPVGNLIAAEPTEKLKELWQERDILEQQYQASQSPKIKSAYLDLTKRIILEQANIHVKSYGYFYEYYLRTQDPNLTRSGSR